MQALYLHIKDGFRVNINVLLFLDVVCKAHLVVTLDFHQILKRGVILGKRLELFKLRAVLDKAGADFLFEVCGQFRVCLAKPTPVGNTVGNIGKLARG